MIGNSQGEDLQKSLEKDYEEMVSAIASNHPPHVRLNATAKWGMKISGGTSKTRTVTLPTKDGRLTAGKFAFRRLLMSLLGGSGNRTRLSTSEAEALARNLLEDAADITVLGATKS